jgi:ankyrin repeat protein
MAFCRLLLAVTVMLGSVTINASGQEQAELSEIRHSMLQGFLAAARTNNADKLNAGLKAGVPVDSADASGRTALMIATHANAIDAARVLIEAGADVNATDQQHDSPYLYAGAEGRLEILKMTMAAGADLKAVNRYGGTALIPAAHHGHVEVVRYLLTTKTDIDHVNFLGWTALLEAVILGDGGPVYQEIVALLLQAGADTSIGDKEGVTALEHARSHGQAEIVRLLEKAAEKRD